MAPQYNAQTVTNVFESPWAKKGLAFVGKRYVPITAGTRQNSPEGVTLVFSHCAGSHKEVWEPVIDRLFADDGARPQRLIREAWAFDMQNHGEAAVLNEATLKEGKTGLTVEECGEGFKAFCASGALNGHRLVGIGHSLGTSALILSTVTTPALPGVAYASLVLVEPAIITRAAYAANRADRETALKAMNVAISKRKSAWPSRDAARAYFTKRFPWQTWDARVLDLLLRHGLRETEGGGVQLCCDPEHERRAYHQDEVYYDVVDRLVALDSSIPVHYIVGARYDVMPEYVYTSVQGAKPPTTLQRVPKAGHFTPHQNPEGMAIAIDNILTGAAVTGSSAKL